ncbi:MAG: helicase C-terminal domain-containing protein [Rectinemataceae bacterium]
MAKEPRTSATFPADRKLAPEAAETLAEAIAEIEGRELFAMGFLDAASGLVTMVDILARGSFGAVPAGYENRPGPKVLIHNHPSGVLFPSDADVEVAARAATEGIGSYIINNDVTTVFVVQEPHQAKKLKKLDSEDIAGVLDRGGKLSGLMPDFEPREAQVDLARDIADTLSTGGILIAEAGTGVGKSFAYLVPALAWALGNRERVIVSTATKPLQDQLFKKDCPVVVRLFKDAPSVALVKGRNNYLCKRRLDEALMEDSLFSESSRQLKMLVAWDEHGGSGDRADLPEAVDDAVWGRVCSESESCLAARCAWHNRCHLMRVRMEASAASIVITNHHVLLADLETRRRAEGAASSVLPDYKTLVLDEAHALEQSATSLFTQYMSRLSTKRILQRLLRRKGRRQAGLLISVGSLPGASQECRTKAESCVAAVERAMEALDAAATAVLQSKAGSPSRSMLLTQAYTLDGGLPRLMRSFHRDLTALIQAVQDLADTVAEDHANDDHMLELALVLRVLNEQAALAERCIDPSRETDTIFWIEKEITTRQEPVTAFNATPLEVAPLLKERLFGQLRACICTSATLAIGDSFTWWRGRVGLDNPASRTRTKRYPSPFPYRTNALVAIADPAPSPDSGPAYAAFLKDAIPELLTASEGRSLVLFTSYEMLNTVFEHAAPLMERQGIVCMKQGREDRLKLLQAFRQDIHSVLFATDSFWEGIDAPGETLSQVIITKLPFKVPTEPVQASRAAAVEARGGSSFAEMSIPEAVIRFKQGFGRLIRHSKDRGVVTILDVRIVQKSYGRLFLGSLPECSIAQGPVQDLCRNIQEFLEQGYQHA